MKIYLTDLSCRFPPYTSRLFKAIHARLGNEAELFVSGSSSHHAHLFPHNTDLFYNFSRRFVSDPRRQHHTFHKGIKIGEYLINRFLFERKVSREKPDAIHFQYLPLLEFWPAYELDKITRYRERNIKIIYTVHNILPHKNGQKYRERYKKLYTMADVLIAHTDLARKELIGQFGIPEDTVKLVPHGILGNEIETVDQGIARTKLDLADNQKMVLFYGGINPYKGLDFLIETWASMDTRGMTLIMAGSGPQEYLDHLHSLIDKYSLNNSVLTKFYYLSDEELSLLIDASDVLLFPYKRITQSGALFMGMGRGKAVIATRIGGFLEVIEEGTDGELVDYGDRKQLGDKILNLLQDDEYRQVLARNARKKMTDHYSWDRIADTTIDLYHSTIK